MVTACAYAVELRKVMPNLVMGVNLFGAQFQSGQLAKDVMNVLEATSLPPDALEIEITENVFIGDRQRVTDSLLAISRESIRIASFVG